MQENKRKITIFVEKRAFKHLISTPNVTEHRANISTLRQVYLVLNTNISSIRVYSGTIGKYLLSRSV